MPTETGGEGAQGTGDVEGYSRVTGAFWGALSIYWHYLDLAWSVGPESKTGTQKPSFPSQSYEPGRLIGLRWPFTLLSVY